MSHDPTLTGVFDDLRPRLFGIAYRMLGVRADAEDVLQDAWLRWSDADHAGAAVRRGLAGHRRDAARHRPAARGQDRARALRRHVAARAARARSTSARPKTAAELASDLSVAFLHLLERLGPEERAAFLLRAGVRLRLRRDRRHAGQERGRRAARWCIAPASACGRSGRASRFRRETHRRLLEKFCWPRSSGERDALRALLADDVETHRRRRRQGAVRRRRHAWRATA